MPKKITGGKENNPKKSKPSKGQNQIPNLPIRAIPTFKEIQDEVIVEKLFTIDDMIDVWCRGCTNGATLWQYCQDNIKPLPSSFECGLTELVNEVRNSDDKSHALQQLINNNMILLGVFDEKI